MNDINNISNHVKNVCKIGQGNACCRYLVISGQGFECVKNTDMKAYLDSRVAMETMIARANNCDGKEIKDLNSLIIVP
jgi:hypothetical protein